MLDKDQLNDIVAGIAKNYSEREEIFFTDPNKHFPNKLAIVNIVKDLRRVMFPRYFGDETPTAAPASTSTPARRSASTSSSTMQPASLSARPPRLATT